MSDSGSASSNSWTILTPEETVAETLRPLAEETEHQEDTPTAEHAGYGAESQPEEGDVSAVSVEDHQVVERATGPDEDTGPDAALDTDLTPSSVNDLPPPSSLEVPAPSLPDSVSHSQSEGLLESQDLSSADPDSFSDSYTHISPSPEEPPASLLTTETLGEVDLTQEEEALLHEETPYPLNGEGLMQEEEEPELSQRGTDFGKQAAPDSPVDSEEVVEEEEERAEEKREVEGEPEVRRRRSSLLAVLERIGRREEEEEVEEEFHLPQREEESGFWVNKCILGAVILLVLGTIFFSEGDHGTRELRDAQVPVKEEWLNPEVPPPSLDVDSAELLNKLAKGNQQIAVLQAQLQAQKEELKVAAGQAAEGVKERLRREEVEKENGRLKKEMASLPVLQKENERMKRELESVPALQRELETLRATVTELKLSTANEAAPLPVTPTASPPSGQAGDSSQDATKTTETQTQKPLEGEKVETEKDWKKEKHDTGEKRDWKERDKLGWKEGEKKERKEEGKVEWKEKEKDRKKGKYEQGKHENEREGKGWKQKEKKKKDWKEGGELKKERASRGDEGKPWKDRDGKKERKEKSERREWEEDKEWKKGKHEKWNHHKERRVKDEKKERRGGKEHGEKREDWRKGKDDHKENDKGWREKWEKNERKEKGEKKEWKKDGNWKHKHGKDDGGEGQGKIERKQWSKEGERKREGWMEGRKDGDWKRDKGSAHKRKDEHKHDKYEKHHHDHQRQKEDLWQGPGEKKPAHTHHRPSLEEPEYWVHQRERLQHNPSPSDRCDSVETCAQAEGLHPVALPEFESILQGYLAKAEGAGEEAPRREELSKLTTEFFRDGVFVHDQMSFLDFVEDVGDILEDMVEGEEEEEDKEEEEDSAIEKEMEEFESEILKKFSVPGAGEREERKKGEWRKESGRGRG